MPRDDPAGAVVDGWEAAGCPPAYGVAARGGTDHTVVLSTVDRLVGTLGVIDVYWLDGSLTDGLTALLVDLSEVSSSPLAVLTHAGRGLERAGWTSREGEHMLAVEASQGPVFFGLRLGLPGVAHRTVLGDELVAMFGEDRLAALPPSWPIAEAADGCSPPPTTRWSGPTTAGARVRPRSSRPWGRSTSSTRPPGRSRAW